MIKGACEDEKKIDYISSHILKHDTNDPIIELERPFQDSKNYR